MVEKQHDSGNMIDHDRCKGCKLCMDVCPVNMIGANEEGTVDFIPEREKICLKCGQCMAVCPNDAVKVASYTYEDDFVRLTPHDVDYERYINFISTRRSVRNFKSKPLEKEVIEKILSSLCYAPYGAEPNKVEITVVNDRSRIEEMLPLAEKFLDDIVGWVESPIVSRIIKHKKGVETFNTIKNHLYPMAKLENYKLKYGDRITRGAPALMVFHADEGAEEHTNNSLIYATYAMLAIHSLGLGGSMNGIMPAAINKVKEIKKLFGIPDKHEAIISIMFGYPKYKYEKVVIRRKKSINWIE